MSIKYSSVNEFLKDMKDRFGHETGDIFIKIIDILTNEVIDNFEVRERDEENVFIIIPEVLSSKKDNEKNKDLATFWPVKGAVRYNSYYKHGNKRYLISYKNLNIDLTEFTEKVKYSKDKLYEKNFGIKA